MTAVHGEATGFDRVVALVDENLRTGEDLGLSLCVVRDGDIVVDLWGGVADPASGRPWNADTVAHTWSLTKTMTTLAVLQLVDRGLISLTAPVATYWPEFAAHGKGAITIAHVLSHTAGVPGWQESMDVDTLCRPTEAAAALAQQAPWWPAGESSGYATIAFGHLLGEVVERVTGQSLGNVFAESVAAPVGADYHIGTPVEVDSRVAVLVPPPPSGVDLSALDPDSPLLKTMLNPHVPVERTGTEQWRRAELGGVNGHGNARSVARLQAALSHGGIAQGGHRLLSQDVVDAAFHQQSYGIDRILGAPIRFGLGLGLAAPDVPGWIPDGKVSWWAGWGGSIVVNDAERRVTMAYVMNRMTAELVGPARTANYVRTVWESLAD